MRGLAFSSTNHASLEQTPVPSEIITETTTVNELVTHTNNNVWEVGTVHADGRVKVEVIKGVYVFFVKQFLNYL